MRRAASSDPRSAEEGQSRLNSRPCKLSRSDFVRGRPAFAARRSAYLLGIVFVAVGRTCIYIFYSGF